MNRVIGVLAVTAVGAAAGWLARCELDRRRLSTPPRIREGIGHYLTGRKSAVSLALPVDEALIPGDILEHLTVAVRGADGGLAEYVMRPSWVAPEIRPAVRSEPE